MHDPAISHTVISLEELPAIQAFSAVERVQLVEELSEEIVAHNLEFLQSKEFIARMDADVEEYRRDPAKGSTWEEVQRRILGRTLHGE